MHAVPRGFDPFTAQHPKDDHERVHEVDEVPARYLVRKVRLVVVDSKHLSAAPRDNHRTISK